MLTIADQPPAASLGTSYAARRAMLAAIGDQGNWRPADCRPAMFTALSDSDLPLTVRLWGKWLISQLTPAGEIRHGDVGALVRRSDASRATSYRYLALLERAGFIERTGTTRRVGEREYRRVATLRASAAFRPEPVTVPDLRKSHSCDSTKKPLTSGSVGSSTTGSRQDDQELSADERRLADAWPTLYRSRSDVPLLRPGYGTNTHDPDERARLLLPPIEALTPRLHAEPEGPF